MRAYVLDKPKQPLELRELSPAGLGVEQVRVKICAVAIHSVDVDTCGGKNRRLLPMTSPFVPGVDFVGHVLEVGSAVTDLEVGVRVFGFLGLAKMGAFAEQICVARGVLAEVPDAWSDAEAATFPMAALGAMQALEHTQLGPSQKVLVHIGASVAGIVAAQVLLSLGHQVSVTALEHDASWLEGLGVHQVLRRGDRALKEGGDFALVVDTVGGEVLRRSFSFVAEGGVVASLRAAPTGDCLRRAGLNVPDLMSLVLPIWGWSSRRRARAAHAVFVPQLTLPDGGLLALAAHSVEAFGFSMYPARTFSFGELNEAIDFMASGFARGPVVINL